MTKTLFKKLVAVIISIVIVLSCSSAVFASSAKKTFKIRWSSDYSFANATITFTTSKNSVLKGTATLRNDFYFVPPEGGATLKLKAGTTWNYKITKLKDGGTITLVTDYYADNPKTDDDSYYVLQHVGMAKMVGKIHIDGKASFGNIWKIDAFKRYATPNGISPTGWNDGDALPYAGSPRPGFYFRDT